VPRSRLSHELLRQALAVHYSLCRSRPVLSNTSSSNDAPPPTNNSNNYKNKKTKLHDLSPRGNYSYPGPATCQQSQCQLSRIQGCRVVRAANPLLPYSPFSIPQPPLFVPSSSSTALLLRKYGSDGIEPGSSGTLTTGAQGGREREPGLPPGGCLSVHLL
jgi:hypothetical protein